MSKSSSDLLILEWIIIRINSSWMWDTVAQLSINCYVCVNKKSCGYLHAKLAVDKHILRLSGVMSFKILNVISFVYTVSIIGETGPALLENFKIVFQQESIFESQVSEMHVKYKELTLKFRRFKLMQLARQTEIHHCILWGHFCIPTEAETCAIYNNVRGQIKVTPKYIIKHKLLL